MLAFTPLIVTQSLFFPYISGKSILIRVVVTIATVLFVFILLTKKDQLVQFRVRMRELLRSKLFLFIVAFFILLILSTIFSVNSYRAFFGDVERGEGLLTLLYLFGFFLLVVFVFERKDWVRFSQCSLLVGFILFIHEMIQLVKGVDRPASFTGNPIYLATVFLFVLFAAFLVLRDIRLRWDNKKSSDLFWLILSCALIPASIFGIFVSKTRGVIAGLIVGVIVLLFYFIAKGKHKRIGKISLVKFSSVCFIVLVLIGILFGVTANASFWKKIPGFDRLSEFTLNDATLQTRLISLGVSLKAINPAHNGIGKFLIGWGPENFGVAYNLYYNPEYFRYETAWFDRAHNKLMDVFVMQGVLGFLAYMGIWVLALGTFFRRRFSLEGIAGIFFGIAYFVQNLFVFDSIVTYIPFFFFLAFAVFVGNEKELGGVTNNKQLITEKSGMSNYPWFSWMWGGLATFYVIGCIAWVVIPYAQIHSYISFIQQKNALSQQQALKEFTPYTFTQEVIRQHYLRSLFEQYSGKESEVKIILFAIDQVKDVVSREPYNPRYFMIIGEAYDALGKKVSLDYFIQAEDAYKKAHALAPKRQDIYYLIAYNLAFQKKFDEAVKILEHTISLDPKVSGPHFYLGMILAATNDPKNYIRSLDELLIAQDLSGYGYGTDKNGPQALYFLLSHFYQQKDVERSLRCLDSLEKLVPEEKNNFTNIRNEVQKGTWRSVLPK